MCNLECSSEQNPIVIIKNEEQLLQFWRSFQEKICLVIIVPSRIHKKHKIDSIIDILQLQANKILEHKTDKQSKLAIKDKFPTIAINKNISNKKIKYLEQFNIISIKMWQYGITNLTIWIKL